ncbi:hypothetical protein TWF481_010595 [Arthrobotrys musiformis]|uniref:Uncharacterized protein n=1 Tax=Arthrobotrys musiformis TaxID=47236 RepID=A0AAV9W392_9PEZI
MAMAGAGQWHTSRIVLADSLCMLVTAATTYKPITLTEWHSCVQGYRFSRQNYESLSESMCSFGADYAQGAWTIHAVTDPHRIAVFDTRGFQSIAQMGNNPPKIEEVYVNGADRNFLAMGRSFPGTEIVRSSKVRWKAYRPIEAETGEDEAQTTTVYVASATDPTFGELTPATFGERVDSMAMPLGNTGMKKYVGEFLATEVVAGPDEAYDDDVLQEGDYLVIEGGRDHMQGVYLFYPLCIKATRLHLPPRTADQSKAFDSNNSTVCFQEMSRRSPDGTYRPDLKPSYIELYSGVKPRRDPDTAGCIEIVFRVYKSMPSPRRQPGGLEVPEQVRLMERLGYLEESVEVDDPARDDRIPIEEPDTSDNFQFPPFMSFISPGDQMEEEEMAVSPRFGGVESEIPSISFSSDFQQASNDLQQASNDFQQASNEFPQADESPAPHVSEQDIQYEDEAIQVRDIYDEHSQLGTQGQLPVQDNLNFIREPSFGADFFQTSGTSPPERARLERKEVFGDDSNDHDDDDDDDIEYSEDSEDSEDNEDNDDGDGGLPEIYKDIEDLIDQLEPEPQQEPPPNQNQMGIELESEFETGIWTDFFPENPFRDLGGTNDYLDEVNTEGDIEQWGQFGQNIADNLEHDDDYSRYRPFTNGGETPIVEEAPLINLSPLEGSEEVQAENREPWSFPTTAEEMPGRLHPVQYINAHNYYSNINHGGDPSMSGGRPLDVQLMLRRLQLGKLDQMANDIKYSLPGNPDIGFADQPRRRRGPRGPVKIDEGPADNEGPQPREQSQPDT